MKCSIKKEGMIRSSCFVSTEYSQSLKIAIVLIATIALCQDAFKNKFPILPIYSIKYLNQTANNQIYWYFIKISSMGVSPWLTIMVQSLIFSITLYYYFYYFTNRKYYLIFYLGFVFFISSALSASIIVSSISPIIFGMISALCTIMLLRLSKKRSHSILICSILIICSSIDIAILMSQLLLVIIFVFYQLFFKKYNNGFSLKNYRALLFSFSMSCIFFFIIIGSHHIGGAFVSKKKENYEITRYRFSEKRTYLNKKISPIFSRNKEYYGIISKGFKDFIYRAIHIEQYSFPSLSRERKLDDFLRKYFTDDHREYEISFQRRYRLIFRYKYFAEMLSYIIVLISSYLIFSKNGTERSLLVYSLIIVFIQQLSMAFIHSREMLHNSIWLLIIPFMIYSLNNKLIRKKSN